MGKKVIVGLGIVLAAIALTACGGTPQNNAESEAEAAFREELFNEFLAPFQASEKDADMFKFEYIVGDDGVEVWMSADYFGIFWLMNEDTANDLSTSFLAVTKESYEKGNGKYHFIAGIKDSYYDEVMFCAINGMEGTNDTITDKKPASINTFTPENCDDLANLLALQSWSDPFIQAFSDKYYGEYIEFDGCIFSVTEDSAHKGRYYIDIGGGDFSGQSARGVQFWIKSVSADDINLGTDDIESVLEPREKIHIIAKVGDFRRPACKLELELYSISLRE